VAREKKAAGRLIAIEGTRGSDVRDAATRLSRHLRKNMKGGVSGWDASGAFADLWADNSVIGDLSPRALVLMFAADLVFRLRWQIQPALEQGQTVVAAPYVETVMALAGATGLSRKWATEVFRFAPKADVTYRVKERKKSSGWKGAPLDGYPEFCAAALRSDPQSEQPALRKNVIAYLDALERRRGCLRLRKNTGLGD
jgi:hypothetical protein